MTDQTPENPVITQRRLKHLQLIHLNHSMPWEAAASLTDDQLQLAVNALIEIRTGGDEYC